MYNKVVAVEKLVVGMELLWVGDVGESSCCWHMAADIRHVLWAFIHLGVHQQYMHFTIKKLESFN